MCVLNRTLVFLFKNDKVNLNPNAKEKPNAGRAPGGRESGMNGVVVVESATYICG